MPQENAMTQDAYWRNLQNRLRGFILKRVRDKAEAEDILQECLIKIHANLQDLRDENRLEAWVFRIARNALADHYRKTQREAAVISKGIEVDVVVEAQSPRDTVIELTPCLEGMIARLPEKYRYVVEQAALERRPYQALAQELDLSLSAIKSRVLRGRGQIRDMLQRCCVIEQDPQGRIMDFEPKTSCSCQ